MAKSHGLGATVSVDDSGGTLRDISNDMLDFQISTPRGSMDVTGVDKSAMERLMIMADAKITLKGVFNPTATTKSHAVFKTVPSASPTSRTVTVVLNTTPTATMSCEMVASDYAITRDGNGQLTWAVTLELADGAVPTWT